MLAGMGGGVVSTSRGKGLKRIKFQPGPLGIDVDVDTGQVKQIVERSEAAKRGVQVGWYLSFVDRVLFTEQLLHAAISSRQPYELGFFYSIIDDGRSRTSRGGAGQSLQSKKGDVAGLKRIGFDAGPLGVVVDMETGEIVKVGEGSQASKKGVQLGWQLKLVDGYEFTEELLSTTLSSGEPYELAFGMEPPVRKIKKCRQRDLDLLDAAKRGDSQEMIQLFERKADVDRADSDGLPPICVATIHGHSNAVRSLCGLGASMNQTDNNGSPAISHAVMVHDTELISLLVSLKADPNFSDAEGWTPLHQAVNYGNTEVILALCEHGASTETVNKMHGLTPLLVAVLAGHSSMVSSLCRLGADQNNSGGLAMSPLCFAVVNGFPDIVSILCESDAHVDVTTEKGHTPLALAAGAGFGEIVQILCEKLADTNIADQHGWTPLFQAVNAGAIHIVHILCDNGAHTLTYDMSGRCPLGLAAAHGEYEIVHSLCEYSAGTERDSNERCTPIYEASSAGHLEVVQTLVEFGVYTGPAHAKAQAVAKQQGHEEIAEYLSFWM